MTCADNLVEYRRAAFLQYNTVVNLPIVEMLHHAKHELCWGLEKRMVRYWVSLGRSCIAPLDADFDDRLFDLDTELRLVMEASSVHDDQNLRETCQNTDHSRCNCGFNFINAILYARAKITMGKTDTCKLCFKCFKAGYSVVLHACTHHRDR